MKIVTKGVTVWFSCKACGCVFRVGINSVDSPDKGENYYSDCPMCGAECHADVNSRDTNISKD